MSLKSVSFKEDFLNITDFRSKLSDIDRFLGGKEGEVRVEVVTERGKPVVTVMPYEAYEQLREVLFLFKVAADREVGGGSLISFKAGTSVDEAVSSIMRRKRGERGAGQAKRQKAT
jgi:PHD/YefM family antitoxin component YafN of YafNO toxin-antitoxin module